MEAAEALRLSKRYSDYQDIFERIKSAACKGRTSITVSREVDSDYWRALGYNVRSTGSPLDCHYDISWAQVETNIK